MGEAERALAEGEGALALAERIGDRQAVCESHLLLAEAQFRIGDPDKSAEHLRKVSDEITASAADLAFAGDAQRLYGMLALAQADATLAAHHFARSVSIFEMLGDRYRSALAHYGLGRAYTSSQPERAAEHLSSAVNTFRGLGARLDLARAEEALAALDHAVPEQPGEPSALAQLLTLRLAEAVASREPLLRELAAVVHQETKAHRVIITKLDEDGRSRVVIAHGHLVQILNRISQGLHQIRDALHRIATSQVRAVPRL